MKKLFVLLCSLSIGMVSMAQNTNIYTRAPVNHNEEGKDIPNNSGFGIKGGVNFNFISGNDKDLFNNFKNSTAFNAGFYAQFPLAGSPRWSIQPEVLYNRTGFKIADSLKTQIDYLQVPLLVVFNVTKTKLSFHLGPYAQVLLTARENGHELGSAVKDNMQSFTYGASLGSEFHFWRMRVGARYNLPFRDIYSNPVVIAGRSVGDLKASSLQVYVGIGFR